MILLCPPEKSTHFHYPLDPKKMCPEALCPKTPLTRGVTGKTFTDTENKNKTEKSTKCLTGIAIRQPSNKMKVANHLLTLYSRHSQQQIPMRLSQIGHSH